MIKSNLYYIYDPMCSWCYAFAKTLEEVKKNLDSNVNIIYIAGGLAKTSNEEMSTELKINIQNTWKRIEKDLGVKFNHNFWSRNIAKRSTYLSCQAVIAARVQNKEEEMLEAIQEAYYTKALNPSEENILINIAKSISLDINKFKKDLNSQKTLLLFQNDLKQKNRLKINSFPSLVLQYKKEAYPINITFNEANKIVKQIKDLSCNIYF